MVDLDRAARHRGLLVALLVGLVCLARSEADNQSQLPASKLASADASECADESSQLCSSSANERGSDEPDSPAPPEVRIGDEVLEAPIETSIALAARTVHLRPLHEELQLTYVHNLVADEEIQALVRLASARDGWGRSPLKSQGSGERLSKDQRRNSSSCPMLWPLVYEGREDEIRRSAGERAASLLEELALVRKLSERVTELFVATGMPLTPRHIEPLQLVRYVKSETFMPHHDYHEPGPDGTLGSSVQGEQRAFTVLLFGATLPPEDEGETHFPHLGLKVSPRSGDALVWANTDEEGAPNPRSLHEGRPPLRGEKVAVNVWVADKPFSLGGGMQRAVVT